MSKNYKGFGEVHGLREWARLLDVNKDTLRYQLVTKGLSVEQFAEKKGIEYQPKMDEGRQRVNRLAQAELLIRGLFERSGYVPEVVTMEYNSALRRLRVLYIDEVVGVYHLDTGALELSGQESIGLINYPVESPKIAFYPKSGWGAHPDTRRAIVEHRQATANYNPEDMPLEYARQANRSR